MNLSRRICKTLLPEMNMGYAQFGEDHILAHFFSQIDIHQPTYFDIGANEPRYISNTYYFYKKGCRGVLVEPNPKLADKLRSVRPGDTVLNIGIGLSSVTEADFYVFPDYANGLSTFSAEEAEHWEKVGMKGMGKIPVEKVIKMQLKPVNEILKQYFAGKAPNFVSLDVEGLDLDILQSFDFSTCRPEAFCVETLAYDINQQSYKVTDITEFMHTVGYEVYADTRVNTIYCRKDLFKV